MKRIVALFIATILLFFGSACATVPVRPGTEELQRFDSQFIGIFDTYSRVIGYAASEAEFTSLVTEIKSSLTEYHQLFDIYHEYPGLSNLHTLNAQAGQKPLKLDPRLIDLLRLSRDYFELSSGSVNIAMGAVLKLWHEARVNANADPSSAQLPERSKLLEAAQHCSMADLKLDIELAQAALGDDKMSLDVGAIAKGYAVEQTMQKLKRAGHNHVLLSVGGNVRALGPKADGSPWTIAVENPLGKNKAPIANLKISDNSVVTSGVYERFFTVDGESYHHIIDAKTLAPEKRYLSVTAITEDSALADALSTALFNMSLEEGEQLLGKLAKVACIWVLPNEEVRYSANFAQLCAENN